MLKQAPLVFAILLIGGLIAGFAGGLLFRGQELANAESLVKLKDGEIDNYQKTINERLERVEKQLSAQQLSSIESTLKGAPTSSVALSAGQGHEDTANLAKQLQSAFTKSGWQVTAAHPEGEFKGVSLKVDDRESTMAIAKALQDAGVSFDTSTDVDNGKIGATEFLIYGADKSNSTKITPQAIPNSTQP